uniref:Linker histone H1M n=1 Tax=Echeneis naucrates TaxID=173247 RepID=A0A665T1N3_ECHNA
MPPKKAAADLTVASSSDAPMEEKPKATMLRKLSAHPSTPIMVREALKELDSRKGVSSQAIQSYIKQKYPSVDLVRLKHLVRRTLQKGIETGTLVRPANSRASTGVTGKFRLAPKLKEPKLKTENTDPNVQKAPKAVKDGAKKPNPGKERRVSKPSKETKKNEAAATSQAAPAKKPKTKKAAEKKDEEGTSASTKVKPAKAIKEAKAGKSSQSKAAKAGTDAPVSKATGKRGKKAE